jgi:long-chain acyl-CoA synthetase
VYAAATAETHPDRLAIIMASSGQTVTFATYEQRANQFAQLLLDAGLRRGDHIALLMENNPWLLSCEAGAERIGLYYTCVNPHLVADEAAYIIDDCQTRAWQSSSPRPPRPTSPPSCPTCAPGSNAG